MSTCLLRNITSAHRILPSTVGAGAAAARTTKLRMEHKKATPKDFENLQKIIHNNDSNSSEGWEKSWAEGVTPWDLRKPTPVVLHLHQTGMLPKGRTLVPGCGSGHDVVAIACLDRYVVGLDVSDNAVKKATEMHSKLPNVNHFTFLKADFFEWQPTELFDLIFDYTFFCAIEPSMRSVWGKKMHEFLKPNGELITLMFPMDGVVGGPPYKVSISDYEEVLHPLGFKAISIVDNNLAVGPRMGREKLGRWKRLGSHSSI